MPIDSKHPLYDDMISQWTDCRLFFQGERAVKSQAKRYLPKPEGATNTEYKNYTQRAFFFPAMERTVAGLTGAISRKEPTIEIPARLQYVIDNVDSNNASLSQFSNSVLDEVFTTGRCGILPDMDIAGGKPYLTLYQAEDILNWHEDKELGLTLVVLREFGYVQSLNDVFSSELVRLYRVLQLVDGKYQQTLHQEVVTKGKTTVTALGEPIMPLKNGVPFDYLPFVFVNSRSITPKVNKPPLLDLVNKNAEHLRVSADYANSLYCTASPILWVSGAKRPPAAPGAREDNEPDFKITIGSTRAVFLPQDAKIAWLELSGSGIQPNKERCDDIKLEMAVIGARMLENQRRGVEAAETAHIRQSGETSTLSSIVVNCSEGIRKSLEILNEWNGGVIADYTRNPTGIREVDFSLNRDFIDVKVDPGLIATLQELVRTEYISWDTFYYNLALGELTVPGRTPEEERTLIETDPPPMGINASQTLSEARGEAISYFGDSGQGTPQNQTQNEE